MSGRFVVFNLQQNEDQYGADLPVAAVIKVDDSLKTHMQRLMQFFEQNDLRSIEFNVPATHIKWLSTVGFTRDGCLASIPGWFDAERDVAVFAADGQDHDLEDGRFEYADESTVYVTESIPVQSIRLDSEGGHLWINVTGQTRTHWNLQTVSDKLHEILDMLDVQFMAPVEQMRA